MPLATILATNLTLWHLSWVNPKFRMCIAATAVSVWFSGAGCSTAAPKSGSANRIRPPSSSTGPKVVLISIDGLRPQFYLPKAQGRENEFEAPTLKKLAAQGARAKAAQTIYPSVTYPSHATIATGV